MTRVIRRPFLFSPLRVLLCKIIRGPDSCQNLSLLIWRICKHFLNYFPTGSSRSSGGIESHYLRWVCSVACRRSAHRCCILLPQGKSPEDKVANYTIYVRTCWAKLVKYRFLLAGFYCTMNVEINKGSIYNRGAMSPFSHCHL